ncbi:MAG: hypothetical protein Q7J65_07565 [Candidatus Marinimicrobia bacterium]|nr:hypothetical protein [Candidatus Neomarinimicrobiota bacterium]
MKTVIVNSQALLILLFFAACTNEPALPDLSTIPWINEYGYNSSELFPIKSGGQVPGPQVKVSVNTEIQYLLIDVNTIDFLVRENTFRDVNFEPQRMSNRISETSEMMFEEGYLHNVSFLNMDFPILYVSMIKRSSVPFRARGIIGRNFLVDGQLTIDMQNKIFAYSANPAVSLRNLTADSNLVDINLKLRNSDHLGILKFYCHINKIKYLATLSARHNTTQISAELAQAITGKTSNRTAVIESLKIGHREFFGIKCEINNDLMTLEPENSEAISSIIGMDVLNQCLWTIDFINGWMVIE